MIPTWPAFLLLLTQLWCNVDPIVASQVQVSALGRPFSLGQLYDLKSDTLSMNLNLWSDDHLANYMEQIKRSTNFEISSSKKINDRRNLLDIDSGSFLSYMMGMVKVHGSARYLEDRVTTHNIARVSFMFDSRTFTRNVNPALFTKVDFPTFLEMPSFTHVVVGIEYGASAVLVIDKTVSPFEEKSEVEASIKRIYGMDIDQISEQEKENVNKFECRIYGDLMPGSPFPCMEAIKKFKELQSPSYLGENYENSKPKKVFLHPLDAFSESRESEVLYSIGDPLVQDIASQFEELNDWEVRCNDVLDSVVAQYSERIQRKVEALKSYVHRFTLGIKDEMAKLVPQIRVDGNELSLAQLVNEKESSPFARAHLDKWMANVKHEITVLNTTYTLTDFCHHEADLIGRLFNDKKYTCVLTVALDDTRDNFLNQMAMYLDDKNSVPDNAITIGTEQQWYKNPTLFAELARKKRGFTSFLTENDDSESDIQFLVREKIIDEGEHPGVTIQMYEKADLIDADFDIPSETGIPKADFTTHNSITLSWDEPGDGAKNIDYYQIDTFVQENNEENPSTSGLKKLTPVQTQGKVETIEMSGLEPETAYQFIVSTFCKQGKTAESKASEFIKTLPSQ